MDSISQDIIISKKNSRITTGYNLETQTEFFYIELNGGIRRGNRKWFPCWDKSLFRNSRSAAMELRSELIEKGEVFSPSVRPYIT